MLSPHTRLLSAFSITVNSHQLSCNFCCRLTEAWELRKLSCKLSLLNSHISSDDNWPSSAPQISESHLYIQYKLYLIMPDIISISIMAISKVLCQWIQQLLLSFPTTANSLEDHQLRHPAHLSIVKQVSKTH